MTLRTRPLLALLAGALLLTGALLMTGCGEPASSATAAGEVSLDISGGFAGVRRGIEVTSGGETFVIDRTGGRKQAGALTQAERTELNSLLDAVEFDELPSRSVSGTARDRFTYRLRHDGHTLVTDGSKDLGPLGDLIGHLESCLRARDRG